MASLVIDEGPHGQVGRRAQAARCNYPGRGKSPAGFVPHEDADKGSVHRRPKTAGVQKNAKMVGFDVAWFVETVMRRFTILAAAAMICAGACDTLAQTSIPTVTPPLTGLATPLTSTTTNCMMTCNSQVANCRTACLIPAVSSGTASSGTTTSNATGSTACLLTCSNTHLTCQTVCAQVSPSR